MIVLVEGIDKSGKTTLITDLLDALDARGENFYSYQVFKNSFKPADSSDADEVFYRYKGAFDLMKQNSDSLYIVDRSYLSEMVYSGVKRDYDAIDDERYDELISDPSILCIYVHTDHETLKSRFKEEKEEYLVQTDVDEIVLRYESVLERTAHKLIKIETPSSRFKNVEIVTNAIYEHQRPTHTLEGGGDKEPVQ